MERIRIYNHLSVSVKDSLPLKIAEGILPSFGKTYSVKLKRDNTYEINSIPPHRNLALFALKIIGCILFFPVSISAVVFKAVWLKKHKNLISFDPCNNSKKSEITSHATAFHSLSEDQKPPHWERNNQPFEKQTLLALRSDFFSWTKFFNHLPLWLSSIPMHMFASTHVTQEIKESKVYPRTQQEYLGLASHYANVILRYYAFKNAKSVKPIIINDEFSCIKNTHAYYQAETKSNQTFFLCEDLVLENDEETKRNEYEYLEKVIENWNTLSSNNQPLFVSVGGGSHAKLMVLEKIEGKVFCGFVDSMFTNSKPREQIQKILKSVLGNNLQWVSNSQRQQSDAHTCFMWTVVNLNLLINKLPEQSCMETIKRQQLPNEIAESFLRENVICLNEFHSLKAPFVTSRNAAAKKLQESEEISMDEYFAICSL